MRKSVIAPEKMRVAVANRLAKQGGRGAARALGVAADALVRVASGKPVMPETLAKLARAPRNQIDRIRTKDDFKQSLAAAVEAPRREQPIVCWDLERIRSARDAQMRGDFQLAVRLAEAIRTDDVLFTAWGNRIAPVNSVDMLLSAYAGVRGEAVRRKALDSVFVPKTTIADIEGTLVNHAIAIGYNHQVTNADGTRVDFIHEEWPLEWVKWNHSRECLETAVRGAGVRTPIVHGDGRWTIYRKFRTLPWTKDAAILPAAFVWAAHANGIKDWAAGSRSHGEAKVIGTLPEGFSLELLDEDGNPKLTEEAFGFLQMLQKIMTGESGVGVMPFGSTADMLTNTSTMYQVFSELILSREKAGNRIYLGTDAALGAAGGAPGVDISLLFDVASTKLQSDFACIQQGLNTGVYLPWTAINEDDSRYAPRAAFQIPDPDADKKSEENSNKRKRLFDALDRMRSLNLDVTQDTIDNLAAEYGVTSNIPKLGSTASTQLQLTPTDIAAITLGREGRASQGLPPFGDERDNLTLPEIEIAAKGRADAAVAAAKAKADAAAVAQNAPGITAPGAPPNNPVVLPARAEGAPA